MRHPRRCLAHYQYFHQYHQRYSLYYTTHDSTSTTLPTLAHSRHPHHLDKHAIHATHATHASPYSTPFLKLLKNYMIITSTFTYKTCILNFVHKNLLYYINRFCTRKAKKIKEEYPSKHSIAVSCRIVFCRNFNY